MEVKEARTNGVNYQLHVHRSEEHEVLSDSDIERAMKDLGIFGDLILTGWEGVHFVITTTNSPSVEKIHLFCRNIQKIAPITI